MISSSEIKSLATSVGFDACGIVRIESAVGAALSRPFSQGAETAPLPFPKDVEHLKQWVAEGRHGTMKYLENFESRARRFWEGFPEAKSIIVVGVNYYSRSKEAKRKAFSLSPRLFVSLPLELKAAWRATRGGRIITASSESAWRNSA
jgi:epoxyqueuosine reductase QueG